MTSLHELQTKAVALKDKVTATRLQAKARRARIERGEPGTQPGDATGLEEQLAHLCAELDDVRAQAAAEGARVRRILKVRALRCGPDEMEERTIVFDVQLSRWVAPHPVTAFESIGAGFELYDPSGRPPSEAVRCRLWDATRSTVGPPAQTEPDDQDEADAEG